MNSHSNRIHSKARSHLPKNQRYKSVAILKLQTDLPKGSQRVHINLGYLCAAFGYYSSFV